MIRIIFYILIVINFIFILSSAFSKDNNEDKDYPIQLYEPEADTPQTYESISPYEGVMSSHSTQRMLEDVERLNQIQSLREASSEVTLQENIELPELSKAFQAEVLFRITDQDQENIYKEAIDIEKLAKKIVKELVKFKEEGLVSVIEDEAKSEEEDIKKAISNKKEEPILEQENIYEKKIEFEEEAITITYLIFGKKIIIEVPMILASNLEESQARLKTELEYMAILVNEMGRQ